MVCGLGFWGAWGCCLFWGVLFILGLGFFLWLGDLFSFEFCDFVILGLFFLFYLGSCSTTKSGLL